MNTPAPRVIDTPGWRSRSAHRYRSSPHQASDDYSGPDWLERRAQMTAAYAATIPRRRDIHVTFQALGSEMTRGSFTR
jgi:hypothetical protein